MKKNLLFMLGFGLFCSHVSAQFTVKDLGPQVQNADISAIDIDGDGDMDIVITGQVVTLNPVPAPPTLTNDNRVLINDGSGNFTEMSSPFKGLTFGNIDWGDINGDGKLDMIENGFPEGQPPFASVFTSDQTGTFTENTPAGMPQYAPSSGFADLNNDGYTDILIFGNYFDGKCKILFNNKAGGFTESAQFDAYEWVDPNISVVDYDNDKDLDIFVTAYDDSAQTRFSRMFVNNNGTFTETNLNLIQKSYGSSVWADYDGDGYLDLLMNGDGKLKSGENSDDIYRLYHNVNGVFTEAATFSTYRQLSTGDGGRFADIDNDGDLDIIVTGYSETLVTQATAIYINTAGTFTAFTLNSALPGVSESSIEVADMDGDGDLDMLVTGFSNNNFGGAGTAYNRRVALLLTNPIPFPNLAPTLPTNLSVTGDQASLTLSWTAATDATTPQNALSYNLFLVDAAGKWFYYPLADTSTGKLRLQRLGNVNLNKGWIVKGLPAGTYRWGVQAVDNSFMGSTFAKSSFTINANGSLPVRLVNFTVRQDGKGARIEWTTASEQNNARFEVERSANGKDFFKLASVEGRGTTSSTNSYSVYDNNPSKGINYYRLLQVNTDGQLTDYGVKTVTFTNVATAAVMAYPNPAKADIGVRISNYAGKQLTVTMTDMNGKLVHSEVIATDNSQGYYKLHLKAKPASGQYILIINGEGLKENLKIIVR